MQLRITGIDPYVKDGQKVKRGDILGKASSDNVHFELLNSDGSPVDNMTDYMSPSSSNNKENASTINDFDVRDKSLFVTKEELKNMFPNTKNILANADAFIALQSKYGINAVFAACVAQQESTFGTKGFLIESGTYNWFGITGSYNGNSITDNRGTKWRKYPSIQAAIDDFGNLISSEYISKGYYTVSKIEGKYSRRRMGRGCK